MAAHQLCTGVEIVSCLVLRRKGKRSARLLPWASSFSTKPASEDGDVPQETTVHQPLADMPPHSLQPLTFLNSLVSRLREAPAPLPVASHLLLDEEGVGERDELRAIVGGEIARPYWPVSQLLDWLNELDRRRTITEIEVDQVGVDRGYHCGTLHPYAWARSGGLGAQVSLNNLRLLQVTDCATMFVHLLPALVLADGAPVNLRILDLCIKEHTSPSCADSAFTRIRDAIDNPILSWYTKLISARLRCCRPTSVQTTYSYAPSKPVKNWGSVTIIWGDEARWTLRYESEQGRSRAVQTVEFIHGALFDAARNEAILAGATATWTIEYERYREYGKGPVQLHCRNKWQWDQAIASVLRNEDPEDLEWAHQRLLSRVIRRCVSETYPHHTLTHMSCPRYSHNRRFTTVGVLFHPHFRPCSSS